jgi:aspartyl aminopeptidase
LRSCLQRLSGDSAEDYHRAVARSFLISADMAHAVHPNYTDRHEPKHQPMLGGGPVVKINVNQAYATDGESWASFERWAREVDAGNPMLSMHSCREVAAAADVPKMIDVMKRFFAA